MRDKSKVVLTLFVQLRQAIGFLEAHRHDFHLSPDEEVMLRGLIGIYHRMMEKCSYEFDKEVSIALSDMIEENDWWRGFQLK